MNLKDAGIYDLTNIFKGEATKAHNASQGGIINNSPRIINIPAYQRPYRWGIDNIERLFQDYDDNRSEYFLGSAVVVEKRRGEALEFDIVDGQQRITTLFLINYIRFLLKREFVFDKLQKPYQPKSTEYCNDLRACYVDLIAKNSSPFDSVLAKIEELSNNDELDPNDRLSQLIECYKANLCMPELKDTPLETRSERLDKARKLLGNDHLCLKYSRPRYDKVLKDALCNVYLKRSEDTNDCELSRIDNTNQDGDFTGNYIEAMIKIFDKIWIHASDDSDKSHNWSEKCDHAIQYVDEMLKNLSLCIVLTENENDANKLFEVLNDRALEVEDLELIKNHFYKEYCTKSDDTEDDRDKHIAELDEIWADKIFGNGGETRKKLISYLSAVYLTRNKDLPFKDDAKFKDDIDRNYSQRYFSSLGGLKYGFDCILSDFNVYYANKIILEKFDVKVKNTNEASFRAEQSDKSITYKAIHLLNALKYHAVMPALTNVIISSYSQKHPLDDVNFEINFTRFVDRIINDSNNSDSELKNIHRCAYVLWTSAIKGKDYRITREISKRIIDQFGYSAFSLESIDFKQDEVQDLNDELNQWLNDWTYANNKTFIIKVLLLNLLISSRERIDNKYIIHTNAALVYRLDAANIQLDHLEANKIITGVEKAYFMCDDVEKRSKILNGYIGNFMILDASDNNQKNNIPLYQAIKYYSKIKESWLIKEIEEMICDSTYFDIEKNVPKEDFFIERTRRLKEVFKAFLNRSFNGTDVTVNM